MEKYVSFRIAKKENNRVMAAINHDMRFGYQPKNIKRELSKNNITLTGKKMDLEARDILIKEQNTRSKRKIQKNTERFSAGIMTFSNSMTEDFKNDPELFKECSKDFIKDLEAQGLQIIYSEIHLDETTPHIHLLFDNISKIDGKSVRRNINPKILSNLQSKMGESFEPMGYKRGESKKITNARNITVSGYKDLEDTKKQLSEDTETLIKLFNDLIEGNELDEEQKELLGDVIPSLFQLIPKSDTKQRKKLDASINKGFGNRRSSSRI